MICISVSLQNDCRFLWDISREANLLDEIASRWSILDSPKVCMLCMCCADINTSPLVHKLSSLWAVFPLFRLSVQQTCGCHCGVPRAVGWKSPSRLNCWRLKGIPWVKAGFHLFPSCWGMKLGGVLCLRILWKHCLGCPSFLFKVNVFLSRNLCIFSQCPKLEMQSASFTTEPLRIKLMGAKQEFG